MSESTAYKGAIHTIAGSDSFAVSLARGIKARFASETDPLALARVRILVPTRRAVLAVRQAFASLEPSGAVLMPQILPLGDVGEDDLEAGSDLGAGFEDLRDGLKPAIPALRRQLMLTRLVTAGPGGPGIATAASLASDLAQFFDAVETEEADLTDLANVVPEALAEHWQVTLDFLKILTDAWPQILSEQGMMDPVARRSKVLRQLAEKWEREGLPGPVIVAGSTGSIPATQRLMDAVLKDTQGVLVLPGLDKTMVPRVWSRVGPTHPQYGLKHLLDSLGVDRSEVLPWDVSEGQDLLEPRRDLLSRAMLPADATEGWLAFLSEKGTRSGLDAAFDGLSRIAAEDPAHEARSIALIMRETLERPGKSVALVTPDRLLARRVSSTLRRWGLSVDDSAGLPLETTPVGAFLVAILDVLDTGFAPVPLLTLLKHPLTGLSLSRPVLRALAAQLELLALRGVRPGSGVDGLRARLVSPELAERHSIPDGIIELLDRLERAFVPLLKNENRDLSQLIRAHAEVAENLAEVSEDGETASGATRLWSGEAGEEAMRLFAEFLEEGDYLGPVEAVDYAPLFRTLVKQRTVRLSRGTHPRAFIWGPLEARLQSADRIILGGLNEKTWPQAVETDPWLSRPMRAALGMTPPERRIGQSAHDFVQLAGCKDVILTRALKADGAQTVASRWLMRLENMLEGLEALDLLEPDAPWGKWAEKLDQPEAYVPVDEPRPAPPTALRPRSLSVTEIETWIRDPYAIYARHVLGLNPLEPIDAPVGAAVRGTVVHRALERFVAAHRDGVSASDLDALIDEGRRAFAEEAVSAEVMAFWLPRFERLANWFLGFELQRRREARTIALEVRGLQALEGPAGRFELKARADRIDLFESGELGVIDYKTGQLPSVRQVKELLAPQLPLEAMMVLAGGFEGIGAGTVGEIAHIQVSGGKVPGLVRRHKDDVGSLAAEVERLLTGYIARFDDPQMPYRPRVMPMFESREGPYDHLARVREWSVYGAGEGGGE